MTLTGITRASLHARAAAMALPDGEEWEGVRNKLAVALTALTVAAEIASTLGRPQPERQEAPSSVHVHSDGDLSPEDSAVLREVIDAAQKIRTCSCVGIDPKRMVELAQNLRWLRMEQLEDHPHVVCLYFSNHDDRYGSPCWYVETPDRLRYSGFTPDQALHAAESAVFSMPPEDAS